MNNTDDDTEPVSMHLDADVLSDIQCLREELSHNKRAKLVLMISFSNDEMIKNIMKYPEIYFLDVTYRCNRQGRNIFVNVGRKPDGKCFIANITLIPNGMRVHTYILMNCIFQQPNLLHYALRTFLDVPSNHSVYIPTTIWNYDCSTQLSTNI